VKIGFNKIVKNKKNIDRLIFGVLLVLGALLRFGKMFWQRDFWYDEAFTGIIARMSWSEMWWMIFHDVHPPLYYYLVKPWAGLFNYSSFGFRSFSAVLGILSIVSIYWIGRKMFSARVGLLSAFFLAVSPFAVQYSQEARMYSLFGLVSLWLVYFFLKALKTDEWKYWLGWGVLGVIFFYIHYLALFTFVVFYFVALGYKLIFEKERARENFFFFSFKKILIGKKFIIAVGFIVFAFVLWLPAFKQHLSREGLGWVPVAYLSDLPETLQFFFYGHQPGKILEPIPNEFRNLSFSLSNEKSGNLFDGSSIGLLILLVIAVGLIILWQRKKYRREVFVISTLSFGTLLFLILLSQVGWRFYVARYFMATAVIIYLLLSVVVSQWRMKGRIFVVVFYVLSLAWLKPIPYDSSWSFVRDDAELVNPQTVVIADNAFEYATARFYFGEGRVKLYNRGEPEQDFSLWIIVKKEDQIKNLDNFISKSNVIYVGAGDCHWNQYQLQPLKKVGRLQVCKNKFDF